MRTNEKPVRILKRHIAQYKTQQDKRSKNAPLRRIRTGKNSAN